MKVVAHDAVVIDMHSVRSLFRVEQVEKVGFFLIIGEDRMLVVASIHDVHGEF
jgi:hypothetical protein